MPHKLPFVAPVKALPKQAMRVKRHAVDILTV